MSMPHHKECLQENKPDKLEVWHWREQDRHENECGSSKQPNWIRVLGPYVFMNGYTCIDASNSLFDALLF